MSEILERIWPKPKHFIQMSDDKTIRFPRTGFVSVGVVIKIGHQNKTCPFHDTINVWESHKPAFERIGYQLTRIGPSDGMNSMKCSTFVSNHIKSLNGITECCGGDVDEAKLGYSSDDSRALELTTTATWFHVKCGINDAIFAKKPQTYSLRLANECIIEILGSDFHGLHYAILTLIQLIQLGRKGFVFPPLVIEDHPDFHFRGIDISNFVTNLKWTIFEDLVFSLNSLKVNQLFYRVHLPIQRSQMDIFLRVIKMNFVSCHLMSFCPIYDMTCDSLNGHDKHVTLHQIKQEMLDLSIWCPGNKFIFIGQKLGSVILSMAESDLRSFLQSFTIYTLIFVDGDPEKVPFECGFMSKNSILSSTYRKMDIPYNGSLTGNITSTDVLFPDDTANGLTHSVGCILADDMSQESLFETSVIFKWIPFIYYSGFAWNLSSRTDRHSTESVTNVLQNFISIDCDTTDADAFINQIFDISGVESDVGNLFYALLTNADAVHLDTKSIDSLLKATRQIRLIQSKLLELRSLEKSRDLLTEVVVIVELMNFLIKLGRALCTAGRNPGCDSVGLSLVNLGVNNLPATSKTDLANRLLLIIEQMKACWPRLNSEKVLNKNLECLNKLLEALVPLGFEEDSDLQTIFS